MAALRAGREAAARRAPPPPLPLARSAVHGAALDRDAVNYLSVADSLIAGEGFTQVYRNEAYMRWPPLWPLLLAAAGLPASDPAAAAGPINAAAFGLTVFAGTCSPPTSRCCSRRRSRGRGSRGLGPPPPWPSPSFGG